MIRRGIDIVVALAALLVLSPLFVLVCLINLIASPGNPFYGGWRIGKDGARFRMWKFRTMIANADKVGGAITKPGDSRVTPFGRFLRATKIDELPQFFNLLSGDLTLIGPRPEDPGLIEFYTPAQKEILQVKPGITSPASIYYTTDQQDQIPDGVSPERFYIDHLLDRKLQIDFEYQRKRTFFSDCGVILRTMGLMLKALTGALQAR